MQNNKTVAVVYQQPLACGKFIPRVRIPDRFIKGLYQDSETA
jgi:hypothetical protein